MGWNLPPGVTDRMIDEQSPGYDAEPEGPSELDLVYEQLRKAEALLKRARDGLHYLARSPLAEKLAAEIDECLGASR